ncbi:PAS domain-containing protein [Nordella sp. HKS 07]|uniref:sensor histidine kinase n=1 Tax=Nordella sp. HKS 07 TaxID=2712222 RepID=UPI0013E1970E|nr:histidine kinase dimerization/phosphoacceptor domain -containing protein [Nordella sp. HKS 07]QIG52508.1 PAS domain-containing protein [Nordella sp. HKS 07]
MPVLARSKLLENSVDGRGLAQAIVDTVRDPLLVLDKDLRVVSANRSFYLTFKMSHQDVQNRPLYLLGEGEWNIPELRLLLKNIAPRQAVIEAYEVEREFAGLGRRVMLLNARKIFYLESAHDTILLAIEDITGRRAIEREVNDFLHQKDILLREMRHRVANSLQIIASILLIKARAVRSEETRLHLQDAHKRVMSVAAMQTHLHAAEPGAMIELGPYLTRLCETLANSMIGNRRPVSLTVHVEDATASSSQAVSIGLIVTELVINALKHAFPDDCTGGTVTVTYQLAEPNWRLSVSDNGIGRPEGTLDKLVPGLGTTIVEALARQLDAHVEALMTPLGTTVSVTKGIFVSRLAASTPVRPDPGSCGARDLPGV